MVHKKNHYDVIRENNKILNSGLADVTNELYFGVSGAAAQNAMTESEYLTATGGTRHDLYNIEANKELSAQVSDATKQAYTAYDVSKPTYGVAGQSLYNAGMQNSGYAKFASDQNKKALKQNLKTIDQSKATAQAEINYNTELLKNQNQQAYYKYLDKYGTVLDDYNRYLEKDEYTEAQIVKKLQEDGYTADQINAIPMLQREREYQTEETTRDTILADLNEGKISGEFAQIQLLSNYGTEDADKIAEDVKNGIISPEAAQGWADALIAGADEAGARYSDDTITEWQNSGIISQEQADAYKAESAQIRSELASKAFDSMENIDNFLAQFEEGYADIADPTEGMSDMQKWFYDHPIAGKSQRDAYAQKVEQLKAHKAESALTHITQMLTDGSIDAKTLETAVQGYTEMLKGMNDTEATDMLMHAKTLYNRVKAEAEYGVYEGQYPPLPAERKDITGNATVEEMRKAVGGMIAEVGMESVYEKFNLDVTDGILNLGNYAAMVKGNDPRIGGADFSQIQQEEIAQYIKDRGIKLTYTTDYRHDPPSETVVLSYRGTDYKLRTDLLTIEAKKALSDYGVVKEHIKGTPNW